MKKIFLLTILALSAVGGLSAQTLDYQLGLGYSSYFLGQEDLAESHPIGFSFFGGMGYGFTDQLSAGVEYEIANSWSFRNIDNNSMDSMTEHIPRAFVRFYSPSSLVLTGMAGVDILVPRSEGENGDPEGSFAMGLRLSGSMTYGQYMVVFREDRVDHRFGFGIQFGDRLYW